MKRFMLGVWLAVSIPAAAGAAEAPAARPAVMATITRMTEAVNRGDMPTAYAAFIASPSIVEDGAPYRWQGEGAAKAWIDSMGANAQAQGLKGINMRLGPPSRIEATGERAYAIVPGRLSYTMKDGHSEHADGSLTFTLQGAGGDWKIESMVWTGPVAKR
jgi:ketosteroid isomerase-like protein